MSLDAPYGDGPDLSDPLPAPRPPASWRPLAEACRMPGHYYIDLGNLCNLRCPFCVTGAKKTRTPEGFMSLAQFSIIFEKIRQHAKLISLYNWGEPFLNRELLPIIRLAASAGARVHIDSNLAMRDFSEAECEEIIRSGLFSLFASVDGTSQESYSKYRQRGKLDRVLANLRRLIAAKLRLNSPFPILGWQFHVHAGNEHEIDQARAMAMDLGIGIVFKRLNAPDPSWWSSIHADGFMVLQGEAWFRQIYMPPENPDFRAKMLPAAVRSPCGQLFATMTVAWNGDVMPCTCVEGPDYAMGNLLTQTLAEVWNGPEFVKSREFVLNYGPEQGGCSVCERLTCPIKEKFLPPLSPAQLR